MSNDFKRIMFEFSSGLPFYGVLHTAVQSVKCELWRKRGRPLPPPHGVKQKILRRIADQHGLNILVETGTHLGDMVYAQKNRFKAIYSIELGETLYRRAARRFRKYPHIKIIHGDSGDVLRELVPQLKAPALFWLDGHYSGAGTALGEDHSPIFRELNAIFTMPVPYVIAIDDARLFGCDPGYPTMDELIEFARSGRKRQLTTNIMDDIVIVNGIKSDREQCDHDDSN